MSKTPSNSSTPVKSKKSTEEGIFLQPIDQQYIKNFKLCEQEDYTGFFTEYEQNSNLIKMMTECETSAESESEKNSEETKLSFTKKFLVTDWERNADDFVKIQKFKVIESRQLQLGSPMAMRTRAYSSNSTKLSFETKQSEIFFHVSPFNAFSNNLNIFMK